MGYYHLFENINLVLCLNNDNIIVMSNIQVISIRNI
jgi:hypothetical protein